MRVTWRGLFISICASVPLAAVHEPQVSWYNSSQTTTLSAANAVVSIPNPTNRLSKNLILVCIAPPSYFINYSVITYRVKSFDLHATGAMYG